MPAGPTRQLERVGLGVDHRSRHRVPTDLGESDGPAVGREELEHGSHEPRPALLGAGEHDPGLSEHRGEVIEQHRGVGPGHQVARLGEAAGGPRPERGADHTPGEAHLQRAQPVVREHRSGRGPPRRCGHEEVAGRAAHGQELGHHPAVTGHWLMRRSGVEPTTVVRADDQLRQGWCGPPVLDRRAGHVVIVTFLPPLTDTTIYRRLAHCGGALGGYRGAGPKTATPAHRATSGAPRSPSGRDATAIRTSSNCTSLDLVVPPGPSTRSRTALGTWPVEVIDGCGTPSTRTYAT